jgi:hypothetical protein
MPDDFESKLRSGSAQIAAATAPRPAHLIRARGDRRRRLRAAGSLALAVAVITGGGGAAYAAIGHGGRPADRLTHGAVPATATPSASSSPSQVAPPLAGRPGIVAVTKAGAVVRLNPATGVVTRTLVAGGAIGDEISVSPDGSTVYFAAATHGCTDEIESVPVTGGSPTWIAQGNLPAISPDGTRLAFFRWPQSCSHPSDVFSAQDVLVIRSLSDGSEKTYPMASVIGIPFQISHLSWAPDGVRLAISLGPSQDNDQGLVIINSATARYYLPIGYLTPGNDGVPVTGQPQAADSYYHQGVFLPDGDLFVNRVCCGGIPIKTTSSLMWEIDTSGRLIHQVAAGFTNRDHTSLDADPSGRWLLYLSGNDLFITTNRSTPSMLTSGLVAAAWQ